MGVVIRYEGYTIVVYPRDHRGGQNNEIHCHVFWGDHQVRVFVPSLEIEWVTRRPKSGYASDIRDIRNLVVARQRAIGREWRRYHGN